MIPVADCYIEMVSAQYDITPVPVAECIVWQAVEPPEYIEAGMAAEYIVVPAHLIDRKGRTQFHSDLNYSFPSPLSPHWLA